MFQPDSIYEFYIILHTWAFLGGQRGIGETKQYLKIPIPLEFYLVARNILYSGKHFKQIPFLDHKSNVNV